ncbi:hypothetical protein [Mycobacterium paraintracellulare]|uniref:hypothetical protein n=1 Tax=Mycobacterium paraintracellulare TaxID=1138383 RepID=UPI00192899DA|nr:hypothetical protein [Mycobacterium paraintracellulare]
MSDEEQQFADVAYKIASVYANRSFGDRDAIDAYWDDCRKAGMCGLGVPEEHGGRGRTSFPWCLQPSAPRLPVSRLAGW